jgi:protein SCO1/2
MIRRTLLGIGVGGGLAGLAAALLRDDEKPAEPAVQPARFPNVRLTTHRGERVSFYDDLVRGNRIVMFNMMYTRCEDTCGGTLANLARVQEVLGERMGKTVHLYSVSLDPAFDTPRVLSRAAAKVGAGPGWTFLTGSVAGIEKVRKSLGFTDLDPKRDADRNRHSGMVRVGNDALDRWSMCPGLGRAEQLAQLALWIGLAES